MKFRENYFTFIEYFLAVCHTSVNLTGVVIEILVTNPLPVPLHTTKFSHVFSSYLNSKISYFQQKLVK